MKLAARALAAVGGLLAGCLALAVVATAGSPTPALDLAARDVAHRMLADDPTSAYALLYAPPLGNVQPMLAYSPTRCAARRGCEIEHDVGGYLIQYRMAAALLLRHGGYVRVTGDCYSSCTALVDELAAAGRACLGPGARLHVHRDTYHDMLTGGRRPGRGIAYTPLFHALVEVRGGQPVEGWLTLDADDLAGVVPRCR